MNRAASQSCRGHSAFGTPAPASQVLWGDTRWGGVGRGAGTSPCHPEAESTSVVISISESDEGTCPTCNSTGAPQ